MFKKQRWEYFADTADGGFGFECDADGIIDMLKKTLYQIQHQSERKNVFKVTITKIEKDNK